MFAIMASLMNLALSAIALHAVPQHGVRGDPHDYSNLGRLMIVVGCRPAAAAPLPRCEARHRRRRAAVRSWKAQPDLNGAEESAGPPGRVLEVEQTT